MKIICDSREKIPWCFSFTNMEIKIQCLKTGDYTIEGYENIVIIDRKKSVDEIAANLNKKTKNGFKRFEKELIRMLAFEHAYIICEFSLSELLRYPEFSSNPRAQKSGQILLAQIADIETKYNVKFIYAGDSINAQIEALDIFENVIKQNQSK